jgi:hypothetical protein
MVEYREYPTGGPCLGCGEETPYGLSEGGPSIVWLCLECCTDVERGVRLIEIMHAGSKTDPHLQAVFLAYLKYFTRRLLTEWEEQVGQPARSDSEVIAILRTKLLARKPAIER